MGLSWRPLHIFYIAITIPKMLGGLSNDFAEGCGRKLGNDFLFPVLAFLEFSEEFLMGGMSFMPISA